MPGEVPTVEFTAVLVRRADGWRVQFVYDDGTYQDQEQSPFATQAEAQRALDTWVSAQQEQHGSLVRVMPRQ